MVTVAALSSVPARADFLIVGGCVGGHGAGNCVVRKGQLGDPYVRQVPTPDSQAEKDRLTQHEHKWITRCHPVIVSDDYGVARYRYAAKGCEFGVSE